VLGATLAAIQIAALFGAKPVIATSRSAAKLARLKSLASMCNRSTQQAQVQAVMAATQRGVDSSSTWADLRSGEHGKPRNQGRLGRSRGSGRLTAQIDLSVLWLRRLSSWA
jgi:NADPH2:quinone reductase